MTRVTKRMHLLEANIEELEARIEAQIGASMEEEEKTEIIEISMTERL